MNVYQKSGSIVSAVLAGKGAIKTLVYKNSNSVNSENKSIYALVCQTIKYKSILEEIIVKSDLAKEYNKPKNSKYRALVLVLTYDIIVNNDSNGSHRRKNKIKNQWYNAILKNKNGLLAQLARLKINRGVSNNEDLLPSHHRIPPLLKYARINTVITDYEAAASKLSDKYGFVHCRHHNSQQCDCGQNRFWTDTDIENMIVFPPKSVINVAELDMIAQSNELILQNKASCFSAAAMDAPPHWNVLDACAAPGNKTSHLICIQRTKLQLSGDDCKKGEIWAFDRDRKRFHTLKQRLKAMQMGDLVTTKNQDFLQYSAHSVAAKRFDAILLDPTCSGSGLEYHRLSHYDDKRKTKIPQLAAMQKQLLLHAMSFPNVRRIVYSTCSVNGEENEGVISSVLRSQTQFQTVKILPHWQQRGINGYGSNVNTDHFVRSYPRKHGINGFFVACLQRDIDHSSAICVKDFLEQSSDDSDGDANEMSTTNRKRSFNAMQQTDSISSNINLTGQSGSTNGQNK